MLEAAALDLVTTGFAKIYFNRFANVPEYYSKICNVNTSDKYSEKTSAFSSLGSWMNKNPGAVIEYEDAVQGYDQTTTHTTYAKGFRVQEELLDDDLYGILKRIPKDMGRGARNVIEQKVANIYNNAFATTTWADGVYLCSASHPIEGSTQSNTGGAVDLAASTLETARIAMETMVDYKGLLLGIKAKILLVPPALEDTALKLVKSTNDPESAENAINPIKNYGLTIVVNPYLTDTDAWFLLADDIAIDMYWRKKPTFSSHIDEDTGDAKFLGKMRASVTVADYLGVYGASG